MSANSGGQKYEFGLIPDRDLKFLLWRWKRQKNNLNFNKYFLIAITTGQAFTSKKRITAMMRGEGEYTADYRQYILSHVKTEMEKNDLNADELKWLKKYNSFEFPIGAYVRDKEDATRVWRVKFRNTEKKKRLYDLVRYVWYTRKKSGKKSGKPIYQFNLPEERLEQVPAPSLLTSKGLPFSGSAPAAALAATPAPAAPAAP